MITFLMSKKDIQIHPITRNNRTNSFGGPKKGGPKGKKSMNIVVNPCLSNIFFGPEEEIMNDFVAHALGGEGLVVSRES